MNLDLARNLIVQENEYCMICGGEMPSDEIKSHQSKCAQNISINQQQNLDHELALYYQENPSIIVTNQKLKINQVPIKQEIQKMDLQQQQQMYFIDDRQKQQQQDQQQTFLNNKRQGNNLQQNQKIIENSKVQENNDNKINNNDFKYKKQQYIPKIRNNFNYLNKEEKQQNNELIENKLNQKKQKTQLIDINYQYQSNNDKNQLQQQNNFDFQNIDQVNKNDYDQNKQDNQQKQSIKLDSYESCQIQLQQLKEQIQKRSRNQQQDIYYSKQQFQNKQKKNYKGPLQTQQADNNKYIKQKSQSQYQYQPGMKITDQIVNQMSSEEIYEVFTQLDQDLQKGPISKIFMLEQFKTKINSIEKCAICQDKIESTKEPSEIQLNCGHYFHYDCIEKWLELKNSCPLCQAKILN